MVVLVDSHKRKGCLLRFFFTGVTGILQGGPHPMYTYYRQKSTQIRGVSSNYLEANSYAQIYYAELYCSGPKNKTGKTLPKAASPERAEYL